MAKKTRTELSTLAINTNLPDNTQELITPTTERSQLTDERESVVNYKDDLGGAPNAGKFLTVAVDGESLTMVNEPSGVPDWVTFITAVVNQMLLKSGGDGTGTSQSSIKFTSYDGATTAQINFNGIDGSFYINGSQSQIQLTTAINFIIGGTPRLTITSGGNVGIGTTPSGYLTNGYVLRLNGGGQTYISFNNTTHTNQVTGGFVIGNDNVSAYIVQRENQPLRFDTNDTPRLTISAGGLATFSNGIQFGGTPSPAYDVAATTLDAYEEGTWTGTMLNTGTSPNPTATGTYTRIGDLVHVQIYFNDITITSAGTARVSGLPYSAASSATLGYAILTYLHGNSISNCRGGYIYLDEIYNTINNSTPSATWVTGSDQNGMWSGTYKI